jgi:hypothetical protein
VNRTIFLEDAAMNVSTAVTPPGLQNQTRSVARAIAYAGLAVGVLDAIDNVAYFAATARMSPLAVLQFVASGALGRSAFEGGLATAALGAVFHFLIAFSAVAVFAAATLRIPFLRERWVVGGVAFGVAVWAVMSLVVVPMSAIGAFPTLGGAIHGILGHAFTVGITSAYVFRGTLSRD